MKTTSPSLKFFRPVVAAALAIVIAWGLSVRPAQANSYVVTLEQVGSNVVATGSGAIDLTALSFLSTAGRLLPDVFPSSGQIITGQANAAHIYGGPISGPTSFGSGSGFPTAATSGSGDIVGIVGASGVIAVPFGYISDTALSDSAFYLGATFSSLGVTPGTYEWTWGSGADQKFTLKIGAAGVPDSGSTFGLLFVASSCLFGVSRFKSSHLA